MPTWLTRQRIIKGVCVVTSIAVVGIVVWLRSPHGTVEHLNHWLNDHCTSVDHQRTRFSPDKTVPRRGVVANDRLNCNMLSGWVEVLHFDTPAHRQAAMADPQLHRRTICSVSTNQLVIDAQLGGSERRYFTSWCADLDGKLQDGHAD
jgi:hypothetical protein